MAKKSTSDKVAQKASTVLSGSSTGKASKSAAGSALSQANPSKVTSKNVASAASKVLKDGRTSSDSKSVAGSVLSQTPAKKDSSTRHDTNSGGPRKVKK
jgi:hypothetical protein